MPIVSDGSRVYPCKGRSRLIFRVEDRDLTVGRLLAPQDWYIDLFKSDFFREVAAYLRRNTKVKVVEA